MKPHSLPHRTVIRQLMCWLALAVACHAAPDALGGPSLAPSISGPASIHINDSQATNLFANVNVTAGSGGTSTNGLTVSFSFTPPGFGTLNQPAGVSLSAGTYSIGPTDATSAQSILHQFTFTPVSNYIYVPNTSNVDFSVSVVDISNNAATPYGLTLMVTATNNPPTLNAAGVANITDKQTVNPFTTVNVIDADNQGTQPQTVTITLAHTNTGYLVIPTNGVGSAWTSNNLTYTLANVTASSVSNAIKTLVYHPIENLLPAGLYDTNTFTISDYDGYATVSSSAVKAIVYSTNDAPTILGLNFGFPFTVFTGPPLTSFGSPLAQVTLGDVDQNDDTNNSNGQSLIWRVTLTGTNVLGQLTYNTAAVGNSYSGTNDAALASTALHGLNYLPPATNLPAGMTNTMTLTVTADDQHGGKATNFITLLLTSSVQSPAISGTQFGQTVSDNSTIAPFSTVVIHGNNGTPVTVQIQLAGGVTNDIQGQFINLGSFTKISTPTNAIYQFSGSGEAATAAIESLIFQPTANRVAVTDVAIFKITVVDNGVSTSDSSSGIYIVPVNDPPQIFGVSPLITIYDDSSAKPFSTLSVSDVDENGQQINQVTVTLDDKAKGSFTSNSLVAASFTFTNGSYLFTGTPAAITTNIEKLVFQPTPGRKPFGQTETTTFTVLLNDFHGGVTANNATAVRSISANGLPIIKLPAPQPHSLAFTSNSVSAFQGVSISDPTSLQVGLRINNPAQGYFTKVSLTNSFGVTVVSNGVGNYFLAGVATNVTAALTNLAFVPATNLSFGAVINFTISVTNSLPNYVITNYAITLRALRTVHIVTQTGDYDPAGPSVPGTLRDAVARSASGDHIVFDIHGTGSVQSAYPAVIALTSPISLNRDITFDGPGADLLTISADTNVVGGVQLFAVNANVTMNRLTFANGYASFAGGAFEVTPFTSLNLSYCALNNCRADFWGGAVDVNEGALNVDHCLFAGNSTSASVGLGGGAVSLYTDQTCIFANTTFATNHQDAVGGVGGGALYAEDVDPGTEFDVYVLNCTFHDNVDAAGHGSSIRPNVFNTFVQLQNTIVADGSGKNIEMDQSGAVISLGGNISDDSTHSFFSAGGVSQDNFIFTPPLDQTNIPAASLLSPLANNFGPTLTYAVLPTGTAMDEGDAAAPASSVLGTDQRGFFRTGAPDVGAFELNASQRIIVEEIGVNPANGVDQFIEFYCPRDSAPLDLGGYTVLVDGLTNHIFVSQGLQPGQALVLCGPNATTNITGTPVFTQIAASNLTLQAEGGLITVLNPAGQIVFSADYVGNYTSSDATLNSYLTVQNQTIMLSPEFQGGFLPYQLTAAARGVTNAVWPGPGFDTVGKPLTGGNAPPTAMPDLAATDAHTVIAALPVLANDIEPDITDTLKVVWVGTNATAGVTNLAGYSALGALLTINTNGTLRYDPTVSTLLQSLPQGVITNDTFKYTILDYSNNVPHYRGTNDTDTTSDTYTQNLTKATATVSLVVIGVNSAPTPQNDNVGNNPLLTTTENAVLDFTTATNILWNDTDPNSDDNANTLNIVAINATNGFQPYLTTITSALGATVTLDVRFDRNQTHITYNPTNSATLRALNQGQSVDDTFYYTVQDRYGVPGTAAISIRVTGVNNAPVAHQDSLTTDEATPLTNPAAFFLANDTDVDNGHTLTITAVSSVSSNGASVTISGTNIIYDPTVSSTLNALARKEIMWDSFTYTITDDFGLTCTTNVTVLVRGVNDAPVSQPDTYTTDEKTPLTIAAAAGVLANDHDPDTHDLIRVVAFTANTVTNCYTSADGGAPVTMNTNGSFTFDPRVTFNTLHQGETYPDKFSYVVLDHSLSIANDDNFAVSAGSASNTLPVLANDAIFSGVGGVFTVAGVSVPDHGGSVFINSTNNTLVYTPASGFVGVESFTYTNLDGLGASDWATVRVSVNGSTLYAVNDRFTVAKGTTNVLNLLANDMFIPSSTANITITGILATNLSGSVSLNGSGPNNSIFYTPGISALYTESFGYVIASASLTATGMVTVTVVDRSGSLPSGKDTFTVLAGSANNPISILANDTILPATTTNLYLTGYGAVSNLIGSVALNNTGSRLLFTPQVGITNQTGSLTYYFADGLGGSGSNTVTIQVVTGGFFANDDNFVVYQNSTNTLPVMVNDTILPNLGQTLYISDLGLGSNAPQNGVVTINGSGTALIYTPTNASAASDDFTYEITDGTPSRAQAHVHVTILSNQSLGSNPDSYRVVSGSTNNLLPVLANDYVLPVQTSPLKIIGVQSTGTNAAFLGTNATAAMFAANATVTIVSTNRNNVLAYTPRPGFIGTDVIAYIFADTYGNLGTNLATVTVGRLLPRDDVFSAISDSTNNSLDVRANDFVSPDTNTLRHIYSFGTPDQGGSVTLNSNATMVLYAPAPGFVGAEHFSYQMADDTTNLFSATVTVNVVRAGSDRSTNTVTINVFGVNDLPTIAGTWNGFHITDKQTVMPFTNVVIGDIDECGYQTNTVTVSLDNAVKGALVNLGGFSNIAPGIYQMTDTPPNITASLKNFIFVPTENRIKVPTSEVTQFTITANDGYGPTQIDTNTAVLVDSVNDAPVIAGVQGGFQINDKQTVQPFTNVVISDVDDLGLQTNILTVSLDNAAKGVLTNLNGFALVAPGVYRMKDSPANVTAALKYLVFVPTENRIKVPTTETTTFTISANDGFTALPVTNNATTVFVTATNDPSTIVGVQGGWAITDKQTATPFTNVVIADVDDLGLQPLSVTVALDVAAKGALQNLGGFTNFAPGIYKMGGVASNITASIENLVFKPTENRIIVPTSELTTLTITVNDGFQFPLITNANTTITVTATNDAPTLVGTATNSITDKQSVQPFATVTIGDVDNLAAAPPAPQPLTVTVVMDNTDKGNLQNLGGFTVVSNGVLQMVGIAPNVTTALRGMVLVPVENHIPVPTSATIHFALSVADGFTAMPTTNAAAVNISSVNDTPTITGTVAGQIVYDRASIKPFAGVTVTELDNDRQQPLRCSVTLDSSLKGTLTSLGGFADLGGGVYSIGASNGTTTAAAITTALRAMVFNPTTASRVTPGFPETTRFTIRVDDFFAPTVVDANTTVTAIDALSGKVTAGDPLASSQFGWSVATLRDLAVIGAPASTISSPGAAYLYVRSLDGSNTWTQIKKLVASDTHSSDDFGWSVAINGDTLVVGSSASDGHANTIGSAYIFSRNQGGANQWGFVKKLQAADGALGDGFGYAVTVSNSLVIVGAPFAAVGPYSQAGAVYMFERDQNGSNQWGQVKKITSTNSVANDHFGQSLAINGDTLAISAPQVSVNGHANDGAVYVLGRNVTGAGQWGFVKKVTVTNNVNGDLFGQSVALSGDNLAVGAPYTDNGSVVDGGAAYIFNRNLNGADQWGMVKKFALTNTASFDHFGSAVALENDSLLVTGPQVDGSTGIDFGVAYLYQQNQGGSNQWGNVDKFLPAAVGISDNFGSAIALNQGTMVVGAYNALNASARSGAAYMFRLFYDNAPQWLLPLANQNLQVGVPFSYALTSWTAGIVADPDINDLLSFAATATPTMPAWLNFDPVAGVFSGTPTAPGSFTVNLLAIDLYGSTVTNQFLITVNSPNQAFNLLSAKVVSGAGNPALNLQFSGTPSYTYRLQQATNLVNPVWTDVVTQMADVNGFISVNITNPPATVFYRTVYP